MKVQIFVLLFSLILIQTLPPTSASPLYRSLKLSAKSAPTGIVPPPQSISKKHHFICVNQSSWIGFTLDGLKFTANLVNSFIQWYLVVTFVSQNKIQSLFYLASFLIGSTPAILDLVMIPDQNTWALTKTITTIFIFVVGVWADIITYAHYHHFEVAGLYSAGCVVTFVVLNSMNVPLPTLQITSISKFSSVVILITGFLQLSNGRNYITYEFHTGLLLIFYMCLGITQVCDTFTMVFAVLGLAGQMLYVGLLAYHFHNNNIPLWTLSSGIENTQSRQHQPFQAFIELICCIRREQSPPLEDVAGGAALQRQLEGNFSAAAAAGGGLLEQQLPNVDDEEEKVEEEVVQKGENEEVKGPHRQTLAGAPLNVSAGGQVNMSAAAAGSPLEQKLPGVFEDVDDEEEKEEEEVVQKGEKEEVEGPHGQRLAGEILNVSAGGQQGNVSASAAAGGPLEQQLSGVVQDADDDEEVVQKGEKEKVDCPHGQTPAVAVLDVLQAPDVKIEVDEATAATPQGEGMPKTSASLKHCS